MQGGFFCERKYRRRAPERQIAALRVGGGAHVLFGVAIFPADGGEEEDEVAGALEAIWNGFGYILEDADDADDRGGIDAFAAGLVVERDVAAGDGGAERGAGFGDAVDGWLSWAMISGFSGLPKLRQLVAATGVAPVQATLRAASATACMAPSLGSR